MEARLGIARDGTLDPHRSIRARALFPDALLTRGDMTYFPANMFVRAREANLWIGKSVEARINLATGQTWNVRYPSDTQHRVVRSGECWWLDELVVRGR